MKLTSLLIILFVVNSYAKTFAQKVSIEVNNVPLKAVFKILKSKTGYQFVYESSALAGSKPVSFSGENISLKEVLDACFIGQPVQYIIRAQTIVVFPKQNNPLKSEILATGMVEDENNNPLPGVTIHLKNSKMAFATDASGNFKIRVNLADTLIFTFIGYKTQTYVITNDKPIVIKLSPSSLSLSTVVVTGYGTQKKMDLISSVGTVNVNDLQKAPVKSFEDALEGRVAGVQVVSSEGGPVTSNTISIRGNSSLTQDNSPLWVVDGFPLENPNNNAINSDDIESITVLKDAASTAIYGSRGSNGVILVTTKKGKIGAPVVSYNATVGFQKTLKMMKLMDPYQYVLLQSEISQSNTIFYAPGDSSLVGTSSFVPGGRTLDYYKTQPYTNWENLLFRTAVFQNHSLSVSGGTGKSRYLISGSFTDQDGTIVQTGFKRYQGRVVLTQEINPKANLNINVNYSNVQTTGNSPSQAFNQTNSLLFSVWGYKPAISPNSSLDAQLTNDLDPDGANGYNYNPIISVQNTTINSQSNILTANSYLDYKILPALTFRVSGGINYTQTKNNLYYGLHTYQGSAASILGPNGSISNAESTSLLNENTLTYNKVFLSKHSLNLLVGFSQQATKVNSGSFSASQVPNDALGVSGLDEGTPYAITSTSSNNFLASFFGRANYNYKSKYYFSTTLRADGSSKFAPGNKWGYFPSAAIAWNIDNEDFMQKINWLSELKLRATYGTSGNNRVNDFAYLSPITLNNIVNNYAFGNVYYKGATQPTLGNENLKWETTATTDIGLDVSFFKGRLELITDYYRKTTTNLLLQASLPGHVGYTTGLENIGSVSNTGEEFTINSKNTIGKGLNWSSNFNISFNQNKVLSLTSGQSGLISPINNFNTTTPYPYIAEVGGPIAQIYGYKWLGNYQYSDFDKLTNGTYVLKANVPGSGNTRSAIRPGDIKYEDINGDGTITAADQIAIGNPNPLFTGGFANDFSFKQFDLNILFTFSYGNDILNANTLVFSGGNSSANQFASYVDRWEPNNPTNAAPRAGGNLPANLISSRFVEDGSYLRLSTISLGYNFSKALLQKAKIKSLRMFCSAQNLFVWTKYSGSDPEVSTRPGALTPGFDYAAYPRAFTMTFGCNVSF